MQTQYDVLSYRIGLYFYDYKLTVDIDENRQSDRTIDYEIKRQKAIEQELCCKFIRIGKWNMIKTINEIFRHSKQSLKKTLINKIQRDY